MPKVRFATVMHIRQQHEDACRRAVGQLERQRSDVLESRELLLHQRLEAANNLHDPALHEIYACFWQRIEDDVQILNKRLAHIDAEIVKAREALIEAHREAKIIAKLQERDRIAFARAADQRERRFLDEFAGSRHSTVLIAERATP